MCDTYIRSMTIQNHLDDDLRQLRVVAMRMDALFVIPGTRVTVGLDNILGLVPMLGDLFALAPSVWIIYRAHQIDATPGTVAYMSLNTTLDFVVGSIPIVGDIFDVLYNANLRNYAALETNLNRRAARASEVQTNRIPPNEWVT